MEDVQNALNRLLKLAWLGEKVFGPSTVNSILEFDRFQLSNWDKQGFLKSQSRTSVDSGASRTFSLPDILYLSVLARIQDLKLPIGVFQQGLTKLQKDISANGLLMLPLTAHWLQLSPITYQFAKTVSMPSSKQDDSIWLLLDCGELFTPVLKRLVKEVFEKDRPEYVAIRAALSGKEELLIETKKGGNK